jgi:hypothetical protein
MVPFEITASALDLIRKRLSQTSVSDPVVYLIEASDPARVPPELRDAIANGEDESVIRHIASKAYGENFEKGRQQLVPAMYPRSQFPKRFVIDVCGIPFVVPPNLSSKLKGCTLDLTTNGLVLRDANGAVVMPSAK